MNDDAIADLKQFIATTIRQETAELHDTIDQLDRKIDTKIDQLDKKLSAKIDDLSQSVTDALSASNGSADEQLQNHERRINLLEHKAAA